MLAQRLSKGADRRWVLSESNGEDPGGKCEEIGQVLQSRCMICQAIEHQENEGSMQ